MPTVRHPDLPALAITVPDETVNQWTAAGWLLSETTGRAPDPDPAPTTTRRGKAADQRS